MAKLTAITSYKIVTAWAVDTGMHKSRDKEEFLIGPRVCYGVRC